MKRKVPFLPLHSNEREPGFSGADLVVNAYIDDGGALVKRPAGKAVAISDTLNYDQAMSGFYYWQEKQILLGIENDGYVSGTFCRYDLSAGGAILHRTSIGAVDNGDIYNLPAVWCTGEFSGVEYVFVCQGGDLYSYDGTTLAQTNTTGSFIPTNCTHVAFLNNRLVATDANNPKNFYYTDAEDPDAWNNAARAVNEPDSITAVHRQGNELYVFGKNTIEIWTDTGDPDIPLRVVPGATIRTGTVSPYTICKVDGSFFFLDNQKRIVVLNGRNPKSISVDIQKNINDIDTISWKDEVKAWSPLLNYKVGDYVYSDDTGTAANANRIYYCIQDHTPPIAAGDSGAPSNDGLTNNWAERGVMDREPIAWSLDWRGEQFYAITFPEHQIPARNGATYTGFLEHGITYVFNYRKSYWTRWGIWSDEIKEFTQFHGDFAVHCPEWNKYYCAFGNHKKLTSLGTSINTNDVGLFELDEDTYTDYAPLSYTTSWRDSVDVIPRMVSRTPYIDHGTNVRKVHHRTQLIARTFKDGEEPLSGSFTLSWIDQYRAIFDDPTGGTGTLPAALESTISTKANNVEAEIWRLGIYVARQWQFSHEADEPCSLQRIEEDLLYSKS